MKKEKVVCNVCGTKNAFLILKPQLVDKGMLYPTFCPNIADITEMEIKYLQKCPNCGYVFPRIDEDTRIKKSIIKTNGYRFPFGEAFTGSEEAVKCYQVALVYREMECRCLAAQWFIYAGVLLGKEYNGLQKKCYQNAVLLLKEEVENTKREQKFEIYLAYINSMRLAQMYDFAKEIGTQGRHKYTGMDRKLLETVISLAEKEDAAYLTFWEMIFMDEAR